jgi:protein phosphatase 1 regulatory subunit 7
VIQGLGSLHALESLWLGKNKIETIEGLEGLSVLRQLDVQSNRLTQISGISELNNLQELYLASNALESIDGLPASGTLNTIDLSRNKLSSLAGIQAQTGVEDLWLSTNLFDNFDLLEYISPLSNLTTIYLEHNPVASDFEYRLRLSAALPQLEYIDATQTTAGSQRPQQIYTTATTIIAPPGSTV